MRVTDKYHHAEEGILSGGALAPGKGAFLVSHISFRVLGTTVRAQRYFWSEAARHPRAHIPSGYMHISSLILAAYGKHREYKGMIKV